MKLIIAATFLRILMLEAFSPNTEYCKLIQPAENFTEKYWSIENEVVTYSKHNPEPVCREYKTASGGATTTITSKYTTGGKSQNSKFECKNNKGNGGQFTAECKIVEGGEQYKSNEGTEEGTPKEGTEEGTPKEGTKEGTPKEGTEKETPTEGGGEATPTEGAEEGPPSEAGEEGGQTEVTEEGAPTADTEKENSPAETEPAASSEGAETEPSDEGAQTQTLVEGKEADSSPTIIIEASVIVTDNEKYSILHTCSYAENDRTHTTYNILLMQTDEKDELPKEVMERFDDGQGFWAINTWHKKKDVKCDSIQNTTDTGKL